MRTEFYNGYMYQIEYKRELSNNNYTQHHVYHIKTEDMNYPHAHKAIESIMMAVGQRDIGYIRIS